MNPTSSNSTPKTMYSFQTQNLRQSLEWVQTSPTLFSRTASVWMTDCPLPCGAPPLSLHDGMINKLAERIQQRNNPLLGIYYETLWQWLLEQYPGCELLAHNLQVRAVQTKAHQKKTHSAETASIEHQAPSQGRTLGEFDLIYRCQGRVFHRELAVKFYLGLPSALTGLQRHRASPWHQWVGPGLRDRLDRKLNRLIHHQINLIDHPESQQLLNLMGIEAPLEKEILIQGCLFYPLLAPDDHLPPADGLQSLLITSGKTASFTKHTAMPIHSNPEHLKGFWLTTNQFTPWLLSQPETRTFQILPKPQWLTHQPTASRISPEALHHQLQEASQPLLINPFPGKASAHLFIVPDSWPEQAVQQHKKELIADID